MYFIDDELTLMMLYSPGTREGLITELNAMQKELTGRDRNLRKWTKSVLKKVSAMTDEEFEKIDLLPDFND
jgi:hypothetical protein